MSRVRGISVPGPVYEFGFTEPATAAIRVDGDRIVYCNIGYEGQGSVRFANGWNSGVAVRQISRKLGETLPGLPETVHTVVAVHPEYRGGAVARFDAFLEDRGWWTVRVPMRVLSDFEPARFDLGSTPKPASRASAELVWTARSPDGTPLEFADVLFGRSEEHNNMPVRVSIATDRPALLPPGEYRIIRPEHEFLSRATPRPSISVEAGPIQRQEWPLEQEVVAKAIRVSSDAGTVGSCRIRLQHEVLGDVTVHVRTQSVVLLPVGRIYFEAEAGAEFRLETGVLDVLRSSGDIDIHLGSK